MERSSDLFRMGTVIMRNHLKTSLMAAAVLAFSSLGASADSITFQNVTFSLTDLGSPGAGQRTLELEILNADHAGPDWTGVNFLQAFALKPSNTTYTSASLTGWGFVPGNASNGGDSDGCHSNANNGFLCFFKPYGSPFPIAHDMVFDITFSGGNGGLIDVAHMQVDFRINNTQTNATGDLMSKDIGVGVHAVPGPIVGAGLPGLILAVLGMFGLHRRRRRA